MADKPHSRKSTRKMPPQSGTLENQPQGQRAAHKPQVAQQPPTRRSGTRRADGLQLPGPSGKRKDSRMATAMETSSIWSMVSEDTEPSPARALKMALKKTSARV